MIAESIEIENFGGMQKFKVNFDPRITYVTGPNMAGKSTIAKTAFFFGLEGIAEKGTHYKGRGNFVGEWGDEAKTIIKLRDEHGSYTVTRAMNDKKQTQFSVVSDTGRSLDQAWLNKLFQSLMISPLDFANMHEKEQAKQLGIDTSEYDERILALKMDFTFINGTLRDFGEIIIPEKVEYVDVSELNRQKNEVLAFNQQQRVRTNELSKKNGEIATLDIHISKLQQELQIALVSRENRVKEKNALTLPEPEKDTSGFDKVMEEMDKTNKDAMFYGIALEKSRQKAVKEEELSANKLAQKQLQEEKVAYLQTLDLPFSTMTIDDNGGLMMDGKYIREPFFSSGELWAVIPRIIAKMQPEFKYIFIQGWNMMDKKHQKNLVEDMLGLGFQLCIEVVDETENGGIIVLTELAS